MFNDYTAKPVFVTALLMAGSAVALPAAAQTAEAESARSAAYLEEIVVTAQKRSERLQDVPISVSVLDSSSLAEQQIVRLQDYFTRVPGLQVNPQSNGKLSIAIRGITTGGSTNPTVGITIDDVPVGSSSSLTYAGLNATDIDPSTLERVEVLRGPQGTLYGAASMGGLLRYVTTPPKFNEFSGRVQADGSSIAKGGDGYGIRGSVNVPLVDDKLAMTLNGFFRHDPGIVDDPGLGKSNVDSADVWGARGSILWQATDAVSLRLSVTHQDTDGDGSSNILSLRDDRLTNGLTQQYAPGSTRNERKVTQFDATLNIDLGWGSLTSITGYGDSSYLEVNDVTEFLGFITEAATGRDDLASITFVPSKTKKFSQEVRLASATGQPFEWLLGLFYTDEDSDTQYNIFAADPNTGELIGESVFPDAFPSKLKEKAVFGAATYHFTERFDIQVGARASKNDQDYVETIGGPLYDPPYFVEASSKDSSVTYLFSPRLRLTPSMMVYGRLATGYRPGGPNPGAGFGTPSEYDADETISYELGMKGDFLDRRLSLDGSIYFIDWKDIQLQQRDPATEFVYYTNGGKARSRGADLTLQAVPVRGLTLVASMSYSDAELAENTFSEVGIGAPLYGLKGDRLPFSAKFTGSLSLDQEFSINDRYAGFVGGALVYLGDRKSNFGPGPAVAGGPVLPRVELPSFTTLDLNAGVRTEGWTFSVFARNVTDERGLLGGSPEVASGATGRYLLQVTRPRTIGLSVAKEF